MLFLSLFFPDSSTIKENIVRKKLFFANVLRVLTHLRNTLDKGDLDRDIHTIKHVEESDAFFRNV